MKPSPSDPLLDRLALDFADETAPDEGDDALIERALRGALDAKPPARPRSRWPFLLAAAALLVGAGALARTWLGPRTAGSAPAPQAPVEAPVVVPAASETATPSPPPVESAAAVPASALPVSSAAPKAPSAAELFARANQARRDRHDDEAVRLYRAPASLSRIPRSAGVARHARSTPARHEERQASARGVRRLPVRLEGQRERRSSRSGAPAPSAGSDAPRKRRAAWQGAPPALRAPVHAPEARTRLKALAQ
ncbi:MAG: hypothetical protein U0263_35505 [Polyangiaceae bacterium]